LFETLYSYRIFHIAAILNSFGKVTKNNDTSKGISRKKISDAGIPVFDEEFLPIKEGGRRNEYISRGCLLVFTMKH